MLPLLEGGSPLAPEQSLKSCGQAPGGLAHGPGPAGECTGASVVQKNKRWEVLKIVIYGCGGKS